MDWVYVIGPAIGALIGGIYGRMLGGGESALRHARELLTSLKQK